MITPARASAIAHGDMPFHNPISERSLEAVLDLLALGRGDRVLDVGCGRGELLVRIAERTGAGGLGIDASDEQIAAAREQARARAPEAELTFEAADAGALEAPDGGVTLAACLGSTHALGGLDGTLSRLTPLVAPGGHLLIGEGYWAQPPQADYLDALGATADELTDQATLLRAGDPHGLHLGYVATAGEQEWAHYEWANIFNADRYAQEHPAEAGVEELHARVEAARRRRLLAASRGETLGFALIAWRRGS